jgi:hypothetical protein
LFFSIKSQNQKSIVFSTPSSFLGEVYDLETISPISNSTGEEKIGPSKQKV